VLTCRPPPPFSREASLEPASGPGLASGRRPPLCRRGRKHLCRPLARLDLGSDPSICDGGRAWGARWRRRRVGGVGEEVDGGRRATRSEAARSARGTSTLPLAPFPRSEIACRQQKVERTPVASRCFLLAQINVLRLTVVRLDPSPCTALRMRPLTPTQRNAEDERRRSTLQRVQGRPQPTLQRVQGRPRPDGISFYLLRRRRRRRRRRRHRRRIGRDRSASAYEARAIDYRSAAAASFNGDTDQAGRGGVSDEARQVEDDERGPDLAGTFEPADPG